MSQISQLLPLENILLDLDASSKKRVFEHVGLLFENYLGIARSTVFDSLLRAKNWVRPAWVKGWRFLTVVSKG